MRRGGIGFLVAMALVLWAAPPAGAQAKRFVDSDDPNASSLCMAAASLDALGETSRAHALFIKALEVQPSAQCAVAGIERVVDQLAQAKSSTSSEEAEQLCARAKTYRKAHRSEDAISSYKAALEKQPEPTGCGAQGLYELSPKWPSRAVEAVVNGIPAILFGLGLLAVAGLLVLMTGYIKWIGTQFKRLPVIRYILRGRLSLADCDDSGLGQDLKVGKVVTAGIRERLQRFRDEAVDPNGIAYELDFGTGSEDLADIVSDSSQLSSALAKLGEASEHTKVIAAVVGALIAALPIKRLAVSAVLEPASTGERAAGKHFFAGAKLFMERGPKLVAATSLTGHVLAEPPAAGDYVQLSSPAAVWVQYEVARELSDIDLRPGVAQSYALVREGLDYHFAARYGEAEEAYESALQLDMRNWAAHVNLAMTKARGAANYEQAQAILQRALAEMMA